MRRRRRRRGGDVVSWQEVQARDEEVRALAYEMGYEDALALLPEDPEPASILDPGEASEFARGGYRYMIVWNAYIEGRVDGGAELPF
jgi:hypothetical protein